MTKKSTSINHPFLLPMHEIIMSLHGTNCYSSKWHISSCDHFPMISSHVDTSWKSLKVIEKTPNLEDLYIEFCNSVWPHLYTVGNWFQLAKTFQKTPRSKNAKKYCKNDFFMSIRLSLRKPMYVRDCLYIIPSYASKKCQKKYILKFG